MRIEETMFSAPVVGVLTDHGGKSCVCLQADGMTTVRSMSVVELCSPPLVLHPRLEGSQRLVGEDTDHGGR